MAEAITVARPYAQAAFDTASKAGSLKPWSDMLQRTAEAVLHPDTHAAITNPRVPREQLEGLVLALAGEQVPATGQNFLRVLVENQRLTILPEIATLFEAMRAEAEQSLDVVVTSAFDLSEAQKQKIATAMQTRTGREVRLNCETDRNLVGGIVIRAGDKVIDGSARTKLSELAQTLA